jgi:hypothetical protein
VATWERRGASDTVTVRPTSGWCPVPVPPPSRRAALALLPLLLSTAGCGTDAAVPGAAASAPPTPTTVAVPEVTTATAGARPSGSPPPTGTPSPTASETATPAPAPGSALDVYLVRDSSGRLFLEPLTVEFDPAEVQGAVAREALTQLLAEDGREGFADVVPDGTRLRDVDLDGAVLQVDLTGEVRTNPGLGAAGEEAFAQALAHTGAQFPTVDAVRLLVEGAPVAELWGHLDWSQPVAPDDLALAPITVEVAEGRSGGRLHMAGRANTFEATVEVLVARADGTPVEETSVTATCGTGCRGEWVLDLDGLAPGAYRVTLREPDPSGGEGFAPYSVTADVAVPG